MKHCRASIAANGNIKWQCSEVSNPGPEITFLVPIESLDEIWKLFQ